jgi:uncharacterized protein (DUF2141 family)
MTNNNTGNINIRRECMKRSMVIILLLTLTTSFAFAGDTGTNSKQTGQLQVTIVGLENDGGKVMVGLFASKEDYTGDKAPFKGCSVEIRGRKAECTFAGILYGTYAIKAFHDKNGNGKLDKNFMGIPNEPYGFSNNARAEFGPAKWDDAKFTINAKNMRMEITVRMQ